jgi:hypothetical protein
MYTTITGGTAYTCTSWDIITQQSYILQSYFRKEIAQQTLLYLVAEFQVEQTASPLISGANSILYLRIFIVTHAANHNQPFNSNKLTNQLEQFYKFITWRFV